MQYVPQVSLSGSGDDTSLATSDDAAHVVSTDGYFEWWYFDAHFDNGYSMVAVFQTGQQFGIPKSGMAVMLSIYTPDDRKHWQRVIYPRENCSVSSEICNVRAGENWTRSDNGVYKLHIAENDLGCDLEFHTLVPGFKPGADRVYFGGPQRYFGWLCVQPRATVKGTLTINGEAMPVQGIGYHDHNFGNVLMRKIISHWYWGRLYAPQYTIVYGYTFTTPRYGGHPLPIFFLAHGAEHWCITDKLLLEPSDWVPAPEVGQSYPRTLALHIADQQLTGKVVLHLDRVVEIVNLLQGTPRLVQLLARVQRLHPAYFRFLANFEASFNREGRSITLNGQTIHELMILK